MSIKEIISKTNIFLSPLSGCTDLAFRLIARENGARFCFFEMIDANALYRKHWHTIDRLKTHTKDKPIAAQLIGENPDVLIGAAKRLLGFVNIDFLDINCACPAKKVMRKRAGAYFLKEPDKLYKILDKLVPILPCPLTLKLRVGYDKVDIDKTCEIAKNSEKRGAGMLFVHGRSMAQGYMGDVDYEAIKAVKEAVNIPVFGSGNILSPVLAKDMLDKAKVNGIVVARGALGNPWLFKHIAEYLKTGKMPKKPSLEMKKRTLKKHLFYIKKYKSISKDTMVGFMRKVAIWYLKGAPKAKKIRNLITSVKDYLSLVRLIDKI